MTWTKLGSEFFDECANAGLSDAATRTHVEAIGWLYGVERMDLRLPRHLLRRFAGSAHYEQAVNDLLAIGWWGPELDFYVVHHHADVIRQSIAAQQSKRERDKNSQAAARRRGRKPAPSEPVVSNDVSADVMADTDRQTDKQASTESSSNDARFWKTEAEMSPDSGSSSARFCSVCSRALTSPLSIADGVCAGCSNNLATQQRRPA